MAYKIITDSCSDLPIETREEMGISTVPFVMSLGDKDFTDDDRLDVKAYVEEMKAYPGKATSSCPSPNAYLEKFNQAKKYFAVTISSCLSGSHNSAAAANDMAAENGHEGYIVDSKSASAGEFLVTLKLHEFLKKDWPAETVFSRIQEFVQNMKTYFVLDNIDNLVKNGRLNKITGNIISAFNIKPIMGSDGGGNIKLFSYGRGETQTVNRLADTVEKSGRINSLEYLIISHCNNPSLAEKVKNKMESLYKFKKIIIIKTNGLSSMYANDKGIILAY